MKKITKKSNMSEILKIKPESAKLLFEVGMGCCGCQMAQQETLEEGCKAHGMSDKDIDDLIKKLNK
jgi:hybrid cluster-associated redox disulfide protein